MSGVAVSRPVTPLSAAQGGGPGAARGQPRDAGEEDGQEGRVRHVRGPVIGCAVSAVVSPDGEPRPSRRPEWAFLIVASAALVTLLYLIPPTIFESEDYVKLHAINRAYLVRSLLSGRIPLWNPHVGLGRPFLADIESAAFYPPNLLYLVVEPHLGLTLLLIAHTALLLFGWLRLGGFLGMDRPAAWLSGLAFAGSGAVVGTIHKGLIPYGDAIAWVPLLFFLAARLQDGWSARGAASLALALGLQVLCGHPQIAWLTWFGLGLMLTARGLAPVSRAFRPLAAGLGGLAVGLAGGLALAAVQVLPFAELIGQGNRSRPSPSFAGSGGLGWLQWASLFVPAGAGPPIAYGASFYIGSLLTVAGLAGLTRLRDRNVRGLALVVLVGVVYSLGERTPFFRVLYGIVPGLSSFRFPGRMGVIVSLALLLAAGLFLSEKTPRRPALLVCAAGGTLVALAVAVARTELHAEATLPGRLLRAALAGCGAALLLIWHLRSRLGSPAVAWTGRAIAAVAAAEIALTSAAHRPFRAGVGPFPGERAVVQALAGAGLLRTGAPPPRVLVPYPLIRDNSGMLHGFSNPAGYVALTLGSVWVYLHESLGLAAPVEANTFPSNEIFDFGPFPYRHASLALGYDRASSRLVVNPDPDPRAYVAHSVEVVADVHAAVARLRGGQDRHRVTLFAPVEGLGPSRRDPGRMRSRRSRATSPSGWWSTWTPRGGASWSWARPGIPGWRATVNGREVACLRANAWMRAVAVPEGRSRVVLTFRSSYLGLGAAVSLVTLGLCLAARRRVRAGSLPPWP